MEDPVSFSSVTMSARNLWRCLYSRALEEMRLRTDWMVESADDLSDSMSVDWSQEVDFSCGVMVEEGGTVWSVWMVGVEVLKETRRRLRRSAVVGGGGSGTMDAARVDEDEGSQQ